MADIANQLQDNREPVLLLYLANELSPEDRAELERILTTDASLRHELESLRTLQSEVAEGLEALDAATPLRTSQEISTRRVVREMRRVQLELVTRAPMQLEASSFRAWPRWVYPVAAVAAMIIIVLGLWGVGVIDLTPNLPEQDRSRMAHYDDEVPMYRDQFAQEHLQRILLASFSGDDADHPVELEETEDPAALQTNG
jgi:anti-sigma factor RsiW